MNHYFLKEISLEYTKYTIYDENFFVSLFLCSNTFHPHVKTISEPKKKNQILIYDIYILYEYFSLFFFTNQTKRAELHFSHPTLSRSHEIKNAWQDHR